MKHARPQRREWLHPITLPETPGQQQRNGQFHHQRDEDDQANRRLDLRRGRYADILRAGTPQLRQRQSRPDQAGEQRRDQHQSKSAHLYQEQNDAKAKGRPVGAGVERDKTRHAQRRDGREQRINPRRRDPSPR